MKALDVAAVLAFCAASPCGLAQSDAVILGTTTQAAAPLFFAPGEIVTLFVTGLTPTADNARATSTPLPTTLAGISATFSQAFAFTPAYTGPLPVPILAVTAPPLDGSCLGGPTSLCAKAMSLTVQIPYELMPGCSPTQLCNQAEIVITDGAKKTMPTPAFADLVRAHVLATTHTDGRRVTPSNPALVGEEIVIYATGLGWPADVRALVTQKILRTGDVTPSPAPIAGRSLSYDYRLNASPSIAQVTFPDPYLHFSGMSPGSVGLYQLNFVVPPPPAGFKECDTDAGIRSNLTVTILGNSIDGAAICVKNPPAQ